MDIVCFANDWDGDPLSKKHIMRRLARRGSRVLWVNSLGNRAPRLACAGDWRRAWRKVARFSRSALEGPRQVEERIWVVDPLAAPAYGHGLAGAVNGTFVGMHVRAATHEYLWDERPLQLVARVPQHARDTQLLVKLYEVGTPRVATVAPSQPASRGGATRPVASDGSASVRVRPPMPAKRVEHPAKPEVHAVWVSGHWQWQDGSGKWVWVNGYYQQPANAPALRPAPATRPHAEARWQDGYWQWLATVGKWEWINGHWNAPPRMDDRPATPPPIAGSVWERGNWSMIDGRFVWQTGHWQRPPRRAEVVPPPPRPDARWSPGFWAVLDAAWVWNDGYYIGARPPMPAPQAEQPGVAPVAGAVWLHGYWRWEQTRYSWVAGYWERPPGQQYVWVPDPIVVPGAPAFGHARRLRK